MKKLGVALCLVVVFVVFAYVAVNFAYEQEGTHPLPNGNITSVPKWGIGNDGSRERRIAEIKKKRSDLLKRTDIVVADDAPELVMETAKVFAANGYVPEERRRAFEIYDRTEYKIVGWRIKMISATKSNDVTNFTVRVSPKLDGPGAAATQDYVDETWECSGGECSLIGLEESVTGAFGGF